MKKPRELAGALAELSGIRVNFLGVLGSFQEPSLNSQELAWTFPGPSGFHRSFR